MVCPLVSGFIPFAPGIRSLGGCTISGTPTEAGVFKGDQFQIGAMDYELDINVCSLNVILDAIGQDMFASFTPPPAVIMVNGIPTLTANPSLFDYAASCGFETFDWQQEWTVLSPVSDLIPELPSLVPNNVYPVGCSAYGSIAEQWAGQNRSCFLIAGLASSTGAASSCPPLSDPPLGGYFPGVKNFFPFYYPLSAVLPGAPVVCPVNGMCPPYIISPGPDGVTNSGDTTLSFEDNPQIKAFPGNPPSANPAPGQFVAFQSSLVGVDANGNPSLPFYSWTWNSTYNGTTGGVDQGESLSPNGPGSGTGGVTVTSINGVQLPSLVSPNEVTTTASGLAYSRVSQTFNGTVRLTNIGDATIDGPLQIVFMGMPVDVTLVNATRDLFGTPYLTVPVAAGLAPGHSVSVGVQFKNPSNAAVNFAPVIYSGSID
jgi:hypothetical protein